MGLAASLVSLAPGAAIRDESPAERERERAASRLESVGFAASGPGFYLWEEDSKQGRRWAAELERPPVLKDDYFG